jgi:hypothetical protein
VLDEQQRIPREGRPFSRRSELAKFRFNAQDVNSLEERVAAVSDWESWSRRTDEEGRDVLEIRASGRRPGVIRLVRTETGAYAATGYDGWSVVLCDDLNQLIDLVATPFTRPANPTPAVLAQLPTRRSAA